MTATAQLDAPLASAHRTALPVSTASPSERLAESLQQLLVIGIDKVAHAALEKVDESSAKLEDISASGGVGVSAALGGGLAKLQGKNPVWAAIKAGVGAMSPTTKVVVALLLILTAVLAPVLVLVLAVVLLVLAIAGAGRG